MYFVAVECSQLDKKISSCMNVRGSRGGLMGLKRGVCEKYGILRQKVWKYPIFLCGLFWRVVSIFPIRFPITMSSGDKGQRGSV